MFSDVSKGRKQRPVIDRLLEMVVPGPGHCWVWTGSATYNGYCVLNANGKRVRGHRVSYEHFIGPISDGLELDHLCRNTRCVNPSHLQPVSHRENVRRGEKANRTHCIHGHEYTQENTMRDRKRGTRGCRECHTIRDRKRRLKKI